MLTRIGRTIRDLFRLLTGEVTRGELEKLVTDETRGMYEFYLRNASSVKGEKNRVLRVVKFVWYLFLAFLKKLAPARRFVFALASVLFFIGYTGKRFDEMLIAFVAVSFLLALELADKLVARDELALAREIQESLHPTDLTPTAGFEVAALSEVAREVGGDFHDLIRLPDRSLLAAVGDVSGKGISSALYAVKAQTALQLFSGDTPDPRTLLGHMNQHLYHNMKRGYFLTLAMARLHPDGRVQFCRAGHPPAVLFRPVDGSVRLLQAKGVAIGMTHPSGNGTAEEPTRSFEDIAELEEIRMERGDLLLLYSDGLVEAPDRSGREFGLDRLFASLRAFHAEPLEILRDRIAHSLETFREGAELRDDTTLVMLRRTE